MSKEEHRRAEARRKQRNVKIAKAAITGMAAVIAPVLIYLAIQS